MTVASDSSSATLSTGKCKAWPPGFRFHPTDEELILFYLKRKICKKKLVLDVISETDVYRWDPEELPGQSALKNGDRQWFFFSPRDRRYSNGGRSNRSTRHGYWKVTGRDRCISCNSRNVGVKKTLVYYIGRAPGGERTDWVMHEYTLDEEELKRCLSFKEYYALYKVFKKSGAGPKNGEQYGAPFNEEEWADDDYTDFNSNPPYIEFPRKKVGEVTPVVTAEVNCQGQASFNGDDIDDMLKSIANDPLFDVPSIAEYPYSLSRAAEVEIPCSEVVAPSAFQVDDPVRQLIHDFNLSMPTELPLQESSEVTSALAMHQADPVSQQHLQPTYDFSQSTSIQLPIPESSEVTSAFSTQQRDPLVLGEGDFLEIDDLLSPDIMLTNADKSAESLQFDDLDGLGEYDLYHDAAVIFGDMGSIDQEPNSLPYVNTFDNNNNNNDSVLDHDFQMHPNPEVPNQIGQELLMRNPGNTFASANLMNKSFSQDTSGLLNESGNFSTQASHSINDTGQSRSRFSSALWSFVESIPTNPASASEIILANRAFERMSSFSRIVKQTSTATGNDMASMRKSQRKRSSFIFFPILVAVCAIYWVSIGYLRLLAKWNS